MRHLIEKGHQKEAAMFVPRCDSNRRVDLYVDCGDWRAAGKECRERGDKQKMEYDSSAPHRNSLTTFVPKATQKELPQLFDCERVGTARSKHEMMRISSTSDGDTAYSVSRLLICVINVPFRDP